MVKIKQQLATTSSKFGNDNQKRFITIHETGNNSAGANAQAHANLQSRGFAESWHYTVDDTQAIQSFTHDYQLWHAGDGRGNGNLNSIGIEICTNSDGNFKQAVQNAIELTQHLMKQEGISVSNVVQHNHWSGKNCPQNIRSGNPMSWNTFKTNLGKAGGVSTVSNTNTSGRNSNANKPAKNYLQQGDRGSAVKTMQNNLIKHGFSVGSYGADGVFGKDSTNAVKKFQKSKGLTVDGVAGVKTLAALKKAPAKKTTSKKSNKITVDGYMGKATISAIQRYFKMKYVDGVLSNQWQSKATKGINSNAIQYNKTQKGSPVVKKIQAMLGVKQDGLMGASTVRAWQKRYNLVADGEIWRPSGLVKEIQRRLNSGKL